MVVIVLSSALRAPARRHFRATPPVCLNRLLLDEAECRVMRPENRLVADLSATDARTVHVRKILNAADGQAIRAGVLDAGRCDDAVVRWVGAGDELALRLDLGDADQLLRPAALAGRPRVDLLLAMPRPLQFGRLLPMIASLGIGTLWVTAAAKTPKTYFSSHLLKRGNEAALRTALVEGLAQAGDTDVPRVEVRKSVRRLLDDGELNGYSRRLLCHPDRSEVGDGGDGVSSSVSGALRDIERDARVLLAVGPEGGWEEPAELEMLRGHGFTQVSLGPRTLRTDVAVVSLLAVAHEALEFG